MVIYNFTFTSFGESQFQKDFIGSYILFTYPNYMFMHTNYFPVTMSKLDNLCAISFPCLGIINTIRTLYRFIAIVNITITIANTLILLAIG